MPGRFALPLLLLAAPLAAQPPRAAPRPPSDSVPRELVQALLLGNDGLRVGEPAGDLARDVLPPNAVVLGSVEYSGTSTTLVVLPQPEHEAVAAFERRARAAGWAPLAPPPMAPSRVEARPRGFLPSGYEARGTRETLVVAASNATSASSVVIPSAVASGVGYGTGRGTTPSVATPRLCNGSAMLTATASPWSAGRTLLRLESMSAASYSPCRLQMPGVQPVQHVRPVAAHDSVVPSLRPPPDAEVRLSGTSGGMGEWEMRAVIEAAPATDALLAHYAEEMAREGWTPVGDAAVTPAAAVRFWRRSDAAGRGWSATIALVGRPDGERARRRYRATLRLEREDAR